MENDGMGRKNGSQGRKAPSVAGAIEAFKQDLGLILGFVRDLRAGAESPVALAALEDRARKAWAKEAPVGNGKAPTEAEARSFAAQLGQVLSDADREISAHKGAEERTKSGRRRRSM